MNENQKQLETLQKEIPAIIETILTNNKKYFRKLIHKHINLNNKYFNYIHNQIMTKLLEQAQANNIVFIFIPKISISSITNKFYFRPQLI
jgi:type III secretory pathway component EscR